MISHYNKIIILTMKTTQKLIKIGTSRGVIIPNKDLQKKDAKAGDLIKFNWDVDRKSHEADDLEVIKAAKKILARYDADFKNLAKR